MKLDVILLVIEILGILSFSISGSIVAIDKEMDLFIEEVENCHNNLIDLIAIEKNNLGGIHE